MSWRGGTVGLLFPIPMGVPKAEGTWWQGLWLGLACMTGRADTHLG